eukprot:m.7699 g.7699  ORF g.7699 m.7699 type:complete len:287 (+) comp5275_c0_seq1:47-907(+)
MSEEFTGKLPSEPSGASGPRATISQFDPVAEPKLLDVTPIKSKSVARAAAADAVDLLSGSPVRRSSGSDAMKPTMTQGGLMYTHEQVSEMVNKAKAELKQELEISQMESDELREKLKAATSQTLQMTKVVEDYAKAMEEMIQKQSEKTDTSGKSATLEEDLRATEKAFSDLHRKYERAKEVIDNCHANEEKLKGAVVQAQQACKASEERYTKLKSHAEEKIQEANVEIAKVRDELKGQLSAQSAKIKKLEMDLRQKERLLETKDQDNAELTAICDDLVRQLEATST